MADYQHVAKVLGVLAACYPTFTLEKRTIDAYASLLEDIDADALAMAALQAMAESRFFPTVAELRERVHAMRHQANGLPDAYQVWTEIMAEVRRVGFEAWEQTRWTSETVKDFARRHWREVCLADEDSLPTIRAQMRGEWEGIARRAEQSARNLPATNAHIARLADALDMKRINGGNR